MYVYPARLYRLYSNQHPYWQCCTYYVLCRYAEEATGQGDSKCESEGPPLANSAQRSRVLQVETVHTYGDIVTILRVGIWARNPISTQSAVVRRVHFANGARSRQSGHVIPSALCRAYRDPSPYHEHASHPSSASNVQHAQHAQSVHKVWSTRLLGNTYRQTHHFPIRAPSPTRATRQRCVLPTSLCRFKVPSLPMHMVQLYSTYYVHLSHQLHRILLWQHAIPC